MIAESDPAGFQLEERDGGGVRVTSFGNAVVGAYCITRRTPRIAPPRQAELMLLCGHLGGDALPVRSRASASARSTRWRRACAAARSRRTSSRCWSRRWTPLSVAWAIHPSAEPAEVTRDFLRCRYFVEQPLHRALHALPLLSEPALWASDDERAACEAELRARRADWERAEQQQSPARPAAAPTGGLHASASGRQVFLAWMAAGGGGAPPAAAPAAHATFGARRAAGGRRRRRRAGACTPT